MVGFFDDSSEIVIKLIIGRAYVIGTSEIGIVDFELDGNQVYLIDTPGFDDTDRSDVETLSVLAAYLSASYAKNVFIHGIVYLHSIANNRMGGSSKRNIDMFKALCGYSTYSNVAIATTFWNQQERGIFLQREAELRDDSAFFGGIVAEGARLFRHGEFSQDVREFQQSARSIVRHVVAQSRLAPVVLLIQHELVDEHKKLDQTAAGMVVAGELHKMTKEYKRQLDELQENTSRMIRERDRNHQADIVDLRDEFQRKLKATKREHEILEMNMADLQEREQQALLDKLEATERQFRVHLERRQEELRDMEESLQLMREEAARESSVSWSKANPERVKQESKEAARPSSTSRRKANEELVEHESEIADLKKEAENDQIAFKKVRGITKDIRGGAVAGIAGSLTTAVVTGLLCVIQ